MRILISNDDGVSAEGIRELAHGMKALGDIYVVAPDRQRSAAGHGITLHKPLYVEEVDLGSGIRAYGVSGTPADCVKIGVNEIMKDTPPDLILSGINQGSNLGNDVMYSGTVSAAIEGAIQGYPSIAVSQCGYKNLDYGPAAAFTVKLVQEVLKQGLLPDTILNVNVPELPANEIKGHKITSLGTRRYHQIYEKRLSPRGTPYYWLAGGLQDLPNEAHTDIEATKDGYISVSPVHFDFTNHDLIDTIKQWNL
ncbi:MAG TPA: 5'/3'-nucleotidase SurE [Bacilli bacterium]|nr:5'/3'-nucleotidase SurE [Bacilli bacterium]